MNQRESLLRREGVRQLKRPSALLPPHTVLEHVLSSLQNPDFPTEGAGWEKVTVVCCACDSTIVSTTYIEPHEQCHSCCTVISPPPYSSGGQIRPFRIFVSAAFYKVWTQRRITAFFLSNSTATNAAERVHMLLWVGYGFHLSMPHRVALTRNMYRVAGLFLAPNVQSLVS